MNSEFYNLDLDHIRYSLVWEDSQTLYRSLKISTNDHLLVITSAGCNALNILLKHPASVTATDLNPVQNKMLLLKKQVILNFDYALYHDLLGLAGAVAVNEAKQRILPTLTAADQAFWTTFLEENPGGLLLSGKLEKFMMAFHQSLGQEQQELIHQLITFDTIDAQYKFFLEKLDNSSFKQTFIAYFSNENLSSGRDPKLLKHVDESGGIVFYKRLLLQVSSSLLKENFYFRFIFFGLQNLPHHVLPPCYRRENYSILRKNMDRLQVIQGEAVEYLLSVPGLKITKASLSNIFEYISHEEFQKVCLALAKHPERDLQLIFWNLLNIQGENFLPSVNRIKLKSQSLSQESCFYFKNKVQIQFVPVPSLHLT
ncbi:DUF3419 family protein [Pedobacter sp. WC2423]|uniref:DUF3419 family protein n=1 Tax=Pedobacter sp. WC2423 TaxID=3234142 RepID=UPI0034674303